MLDRHGLGLRGAVDVHELRQDIASLVLFEKFLGLLLIHRGSPVILPPHSLTTAPRDSLKYGPKVGSHQIRNRRSTTPPNASGTTSTATPIIMVIIKGCELSASAAKFTLQTCART